LTPGEVSAYSFVGETNCATSISAFALFLVKLTLGVLQQKTATIGEKDKEGERESRS